MASLMANQGYKITLGDFGFKLTEVPDFVAFGLKEQMNVHKLVGGARVVDMIGDDPSEFHWSGTWLGPDATANANDLYSLMQKKTLLPLAFGAVARNVVISNLDLTYKRAYWIDYKIECVVVEQAAVIGFANGGGVGFNVIQVAAGDAAITAANNAALNAATQAAAALNGGVAGIAQVLAAGGANVANAVAFG